MLKSKTPFFNLVLAAGFLTVSCVATTGPALSRQELVTGQKQLNRTSTDYFFDSMTRLTSVGNKILQHLPPEKANEAHASLPFLYINLSFELQRLYETTNSKGVMVAGIFPSVSRKNVDIERGDEVLALNGNAVKSEKDIRRILEKIKSEKEITVHFRRSSKEWHNTIPIHYLRKKLPFVLNGKVQDIAAYTDQNGFIYVTPAVLDFAQNDEELAFILGRQIAYILEKHISFTADIFGTRDSVGLHSILNYYFKNVIMDGFIAFSPLGNRRLDQFTEKEEREADGAALQYLSLSGIGGEQGVRFFERLVVEKAKKPDITYGIKVPSSERLILMRRMASGNTATARVSKEEKERVTQEINQASLESFLDKTLQVTTIGHRILRAASETDGDRIAMLPLLYVDINHTFKEFYKSHASKGVMIAGVLSAPETESLKDIRRGDEILTLNGRPVLSERDLNKNLQTLKSDKALLRFRRGTREWETEIPMHRFAKKISFTVMKDDRTVNAFADIFGGITITTGMLRFVEDEDQLAFVMAHEVAHLMNRHIGKHMTNQMAGAVVGATLATLVEAYAPGFGNIAGNMTSQIVTSPYSKELEREADYKGLIYLKAAGYNPKKAYSIWEKFAAAIPSSQNGSIISTHPASPERFLRLKKRVQEMDGTSEQGIASKTTEDARQSRLGPVFESGADPSKVGIVEAGLAKEVDNLIVGSQSKDQGSIFSSLSPQIVWYAKFNSDGALRHYLSRKYRIQWQAPDGSIFYENKFKASYLNETLAKTTLKLNQPLDPDLIGRWRVRVWKKDILIDDRYFKIVKPNS